VDRRDPRQGAREGEDPEGPVEEVGPGPGGLTRALLFNGARRVIAIERDERCLEASAEVSSHYPDRLEVIAGDALKTDFAALAGKANGGAVNTRSASRRRPYVT